jgi:thiol-disulfide isomerase/thioredoxin
MDNKYDKNKITVGKIYADWCGACKSLEPAWKAMEDSLDKNSVVVVAIEETNMKTDLEKLNEHYGTDVKLQDGFPTLFKIQPNSTKVEYYTGERTVDELKKWATSETIGGRRQRKSNKRRRSRRHRRSTHRRRK